MKFEEAMQNLMKHKVIGIDNVEYRLVTKITNFGNENVEKENSVQYRVDSEGCDWNPDTHDGVDWEDILRDEWRVENEDG